MLCYNYVKVVKKSRDLLKRGVVMSQEIRDFLFSEDEIYLFHEGRNFYSYKMLGAHIFEDGVFFRLGSQCKGSFCGGRF